jgi:hypothetical protein
VIQRHSSGSVISLKRMKDTNVSTVGIKQGCHSKTQVSDGSLEYNSRLLVVTSASALFSLFGLVSVLFSNRALLFQSYEY